MPRLDIGIFGVPPFVYKSAGLELNKSNWNDIYIHKENCIYCMNFVCSLNTQIRVLAQMGSGHSPDSIEAFLIIKNIRILFQEILQFTYCLGSKLL